MKWIPEKYMLKAASFLVERSFAGLFLDPGMRKTSIMLAAFKTLRDKGFVDSALVLAPLRPCYSVWPAEIEKWDEFKDLRYEILHGDSKNEALSHKADIYILNYDGIGWFVEEMRLQKKKYPHVLIVDESTKLKHTNTNRFRRIKPILGKFKRRYILTGTPASRNLLDLFGQMYVMDRGNTFGPYITHYRNEFFEKIDNERFTWILRDGAEKKIHRMIAPHALRMSSEDYLKLPPLMINDVMVNLPPKIKALYDQMEDALRVDFKKGRVTAANAGISSIKCRQIASGGVYLDGTEREWQHVHDVKTDAVEDLVDELSGQPVMIAYEFNHDLDRLLKRFGKDTPYIGKDISPRRGREIELLWNRGEIPILLLQPQSAAYGLNLQESGRAVIWYTLTYNYEHYDQLIRRLWRSGQKERVVVHRILTSGTIDLVVRRSLGTKEGTQRKLFDALRDYWRERNMI